MKEIAVQLDELLLAGAETTATSIIWALYLLGRHPHIQKKIQAEINNIPDTYMYTGKNEASYLNQVNSPSQISYRDLPYTFASLYDAIRFGSPVAIPFPRRAHKDVSLGEYWIQKDSIIIQNLWAANHDQRVWQYPNIFEPRNFYDDQTGKLINLDNFLPYSVGMISF